MSGSNEVVSGTVSPDIDPASSRKKNGWCNHQIRLQIRSVKLKARRKAIIKLSIAVIVFFGVLGALYALMRRAVAYTRTRNQLSFVGISTGVFQDVLEWIRQLGTWGNIMLGALLIVGAMPFTTGWSIVAMACGLLYGMGYGVLTCMIATYIGTIVCFFVSRLLLKRCLRRKIERGKRTRALFYAIDKHAVKFIFLIRFTPLPLGMATSICALTRVKFYVFFPVSFVIQMAHISLYTFLGTGITSVTDLVSGKHTPPAQIGILVGGICMLVIMFIFGIIVGRKALKAATKEMKDDQASQAIKISVSSELEETSSSNVQRMKGTLPVQDAAKSDSEVESGCSSPSVLQSSASTVSSSDDSSESEG